MHLSDLITRKFTSSIPVDDFEVLTDSGWVDITHSNKTVPYEVYVITTETGREIRCADQHIFFEPGFIEIFAMDCEGKLILTEDGPDRVVSVRRTGQWEEMYDLSVGGDNRFYTNGILSHNTTVMAAILCHYVLFNKQKTCAILANKAATAREILGRVQLAYEHLPKWMQQGVVEWNKGSFSLENGSRILTAGTSSSAIRGFSINFCVAGDTLVVIKTPSRVMSMRIDEAILLPDVTHILGPKGFVEFDGFISNGIKPTIKLTISTGETLTCTKNHRLLVGGEWIEASDVTVGTAFSTGAILVSAVDGPEVEVYDAVNVGDDSAYFTNSLVSHNCLMDEVAFLPPGIAEDFFTSVYPTISSGKTSKLAMISTPNGMNLFYRYWMEALNGTNGFTPIKAIWSDIPGRDEKWANEQRAVLGPVKFRQEMCVEFIGSENTLISGEYIAGMPVANTIHKTHNVSIYHPPTKGHHYVMCVDTARGTGGDYSAFVVIDVTALPYRVSAVYRDNKISSYIYPNVVFDWARKYNEAYVYIELNDIGESIAHALYHDMEYENLVMSSEKGAISSFGGKMPGVRTTHRSKIMGCDSLKQLIEGGKLEVNDPQMILEISNFARKGRSFEAANGNDDLVMCLVMFGYLLTQPLMDELTSDGAKQRIIQEKLKAMDEELLPAMIFDDGTSESTADGWVNI